MTPISTRLSRDFYDQMTLDPTIISLSLQVAGGGPFRRSKSAHVRVSRLDHDLLSTTDLIHAHSRNLRHRVWLSVLQYRSLLRVCGEHLRMSHEDSSAQRHTQAG
jgi:hypothetical protein